MWCCIAQYLQFENTGILHIQNGAIWWLITNLWEKIKMKIWVSLGEMIEKLETNRHQINCCIRDWLLILQQGMVILLFPVQNFPLKILYENQWFLIANNSLKCIFILKSDFDALKLWNINWCLKTTNFFLMKLLNLSFIHFIVYFGKLTLVTIVVNMISE